MGLVCRGHNGRIKKSLGIKGLGASPQPGPQPALSRLCFSLGI